MKTSGVDRGREAATTRRKPPAKGGGGLFAVLLRQAEQGGGTASALAATTAAAVDGLLGLQEVPTATDEPARKAMHRHGDTLLGALDALRLDLLAGAVPSSRLAAIVDALRERPPRGGDPALDAVLDDIELRAEVELAKQEWSQGLP